MSEDFQILSEAEKNGLWFIKNFPELEKKMAGKLVAIKDQKIIASADTVEELLEKLRGIDLRKVLIVAIPSEEFASIL